MQQLIEQAVAQIDSVCLANTLTELVDIPSPTGEEKPLAQHIVQRLQSFGLNALEQQLDDKQANAYATQTGTGSGQHLLLYAPIDTVTSNDASEDCPWVADELRADMCAQAYIEDNHIFGLGAHNPKGHAACIIEVARILQKLNIKPAGTISYGFGAGGMPTNARANTRENSGHGAGCKALLNDAIKPNCAIIAKSGWGVSWEEVGFQWYDVVVEGTHTYVGSRHLMPYSNAIANASQLIIEFEQWFEQWAEQHSSGLSKPQGVIAFIESGWQRMPAFTPASCRFRVDLRVDPKTTMQQSENEFSTALKMFSQRLNIKTHYQKIVEIAGTHTDPDSTVIRETINAWQWVEQRQHHPLTGMSGSTDANILRSFNIDTARIGLPKAQLDNMDFQLGMNAVNIDDLVKLTSLLLHTAITIASQTEVVV